MPADTKHPERIYIPNLRWERGRTTAFDGVAMDDDVEYLRADAVDALTRAPTLTEEIRTLRAAIEALCPAEDGFTEAFDDLIERGLLVPVPADDQFREEWDADTMYVWRWHPLAVGAGPEPSP